MKKKIIIVLLAAILLALVFLFPIKTHAISTIRSTPRVSVRSTPRVRTSTPRVRVKSSVKVKAAPKVAIKKTPSSSKPTPKVSLKKSPKSVEKNAPKVSVNKKPNLGKSTNPDYLFEPRKVENGKTYYSGKPNNNIRSDMSIQSPGTSKYLIRNETNYFPSYSNNFSSSRFFLWYWMFNHSDHKNNEGKIVKKDEFSWLQFIMIIVGVLAILVMIGLTIAVLFL